MIATAMSANVFFWIIPGQRTVVAAMTSGREDRPEGAGHPRQARQAAQRAQHLLHAAGDLRDAEQPLRLSLHQQVQLGHPDPDDAGRCADPPVLRAAPRLAPRPRRQSLALCGGRRGADPGGDRRPEGAGTGAGAAARPPDTSKSVANNDPCDAGNWPK